jgi:hypothetical protein
MTTICISIPALKTITRGLSSDWGPTLHAAARRLGAVVALLYTLGFMAGRRWHQLVAWAQEHQLHGLARLGLPGGNLKGSTPNQFPGVTEMVTTPANVAPPSIRHLAIQGFSQREIASTLGLTRYQVRRALGAAPYTSSSATSVTMAS